METTFHVCSAAAGSQGSRGAGFGGLYLLQPHARGLLPAGGANVEASGQGPPPPPRLPRTARARKKPSGPKKPPQRGLGVEQLERLRLQEQWKKAAEANSPAGALPGHKHQPLREVERTYKDNRDMENPTFQVRGRPIRQAEPGGASIARFLAGAGCGGAWGQSDSLQWHGVLGGGAGGFLVGNPVDFPAATPAVPYSSALNHYGTAMEEARLQLGNGAITEFPSSQRLRCFEQCDLCIRKKRLLEEKFGVAEDNGEPGEGKTTLNLLGDSRRKTSTASAEGMADAKREATETEVTEYVFFPCGSGGVSACSSKMGSTVQGRTTGDAPSSSPPCARSRKQLDLSLKL